MTSSNSPTTEPNTVLFVLGSGVQLNSARRIAAHLKRPYAALDVWQGKVVALDEVELGGHLAPVTVARMRAVGAAAKRWARRTPGGLVVTPQDVGLVYRRAVAAARRGGAAIALLPDGVVSGGKFTKRGGGVVPMVDALLRGSGYVAGRLGEWAASKPDLVLSCGPGWDDIYRARGVGRIVDVGNPRTDDLVTLSKPRPGNILLCSQIMDHEYLGGRAAQDAWYAFIERMAQTAPAGVFRVSMAPAERDRLDDVPIGPKTRELLTSGTLTESLGWAGAVVSWTSTTMLEAAGAGRAIVSVAVNEAAAAEPHGYFLRDDPRGVAVLADELPDFAALKAAAEKAQQQQQGVAKDYLVNVGTAAKATADALDDFAVTR